MQGIGYCGQPVAEPFRQVDPPMPVLVDLCALFPRQPHPPQGRYNPRGLQMSSVVEGQLTWWGVGEQGGWWGLVSYPIRHGSAQGTVTHWIPAWLLRKRA
ncbi:hypothetical protein [Mycolicibacterium farcinogenes]